MYPWWSAPLFIILVTFSFGKGVLKLVIHTVCGCRLLSANNPFARDGRKPKRQFVTDRRMRDALLRKEFDICNVSDIAVAHLCIPIYKLLWWSEGIPREA